MLSLAMIAVTGLLATASEDFDDQWLAAAFPGLEVISAEPTPVEPWLEVVLADGQIVYATREGDHLLVGDLIDLKQKTNLTDSRRNQLRAELMDSSLPEGLFEFPAPGGGEWVTVVTDIDCPYCRRLHQQISEYHEQGISVRYVMLPRAGLASESHRKAINAACAIDPESALTRSMNGEILEQAECPNTIEEQFRLARRLQITGTPAIVTESGRLFSGYLPPARLAAELSRETNIR